MLRLPRLPRAAVLALPVVGLLTLLGASTARAAEAEERVRSLAVTLALRPDASMHVTETIQYDFGSATDKHGIERFLPVRQSFDSDRNRLYPLSHVTASSPTGAPSGVDITDATVTTLRIGDATEHVKGVQTYVLQYDLGGVVNTPAGGRELYWNAVGTEWAVPIDAATVTVTAPAGVAVQRVTCYQGKQGSRESCRSAVGSDGSATFAATRQLDDHEGLSVVAGFPPTAFPGAAPILEDKWKVTKAFGVGGGAGIGAAALLLVIAGGAGVVAGRRGRDERYLGMVPGLAPLPGQDARTGRVGLRRPPIAVQFTPPKELRVGELGTLIDEHANTVDVTATIIDLAVRGYLRIEEVADEDGGKDGTPSDWRLVRSGKDTSDLREYEDTLYDAIFEGRRKVTLSQLRTTFSKSLATTQTQLYREVTERGWFTADPRSVRRRWYVLGGTMLVLGVVATVLLAVFTRYALVGVALLVAGVVVTVLARRMPARTAAGTALLAQAQGFRLYLETAEADQIRFEEGIDVFSRYLPYAIVFGVAERWAGVFDQLARSGGPVQHPDWYGSTDDSLSFLRFGTAVNAFSSSTSSAIAASAPSSSGGSGFSGGFSGGGGGGGGGGSW